MKTYTRMWMVATHDSQTWLNGLIWGDLRLFGSKVGRWLTRGGQDWNWLAFFLREVFTFDIDGFAFSCLAGENPVARYIGLVSWRWFLVARLATSRSSQQPMLPVASSRFNTGKNFLEGWTSVFKIFACTWQSKELKCKSKKNKSQHVLVRPASDITQEHAICFIDFFCVKDQNGAQPQTVCERGPGGHVVRKQKTCKSHSGEAQHTCVYIYIYIYIIYTNLFLS